MERFWTKEVRRKMAAIVCAVLVFTAIFQNFSLVSAQEQEENVFYLDGITVSVDEGSVLGNSITIGEQKFQINEEGKIEYDLNSNVEGLSVSGNSVSGNERLVWRNSASSLDIIYEGNKEYFESKSSISGNDADSQITITLYKKHTLNTKVYIQTAVSGNDNLSSVENIEVIYTNLDAADDQSGSIIGDAGKPVYVKKNTKGYQAKVTLGGIDAVITSTYDPDPATPDSIVFRGYVKYDGEDADFILKDKKGNVISKIDPDKCYQVSTILIKGKNKSANNPFRTYTLVVGDKTIVNKGEIPDSGDEIILLDESSSGKAKITFEMEEYTLSSDTNSIEFTIDNKAPVITGAMYRLSSMNMNNYEELDSGKRLIDSKGISLQFSVEEEYGIESASIVVYDEDEQEKVLSKFEEIPDPDNNKYTFTWDGSSQNVNYTNLGFKVTDKAGNTAKWESVAYILDSAAPKVTQVLWSKDGSQPSEKIKENIQAKNIKITFVVEEENAIPEDSDHIQLSYCKDGSQESSQISIENITKENINEGNKGYCFTFSLPDEDAVYEKFKLYLKDEAGNSATYEGAWRATTDNTAPVIEESSIRWVLSSDNESSENEIVDNMIYASSGIKVSIPIKEINGIDEENVCLQYNVDGEKEARDFNLSENDNGDLDADYILAFELPVNATYTEFEMTVTDAVGNECIYQPEWKIVLDDKTPDIAEASWIKDDDSTAEAISDGNCLVAQKSIQINLSVQKRMDIKTETVYLYYTNDEGEQKIQGNVGNEEGNYGNKKYPFTFKLPQEDANCTDFYLEFEDVTGERYKVDLGWSAIIDGTDPVIESIFWTSEKADNEPSDIMPADVLVDSKKVDLIVNIIEKNIQSVGLYSIEDGKEILIEEKEQDRNTDKTRYTFEISTNQYNYKSLFFKVTDIAGNASSYGYEDNNSLKVIIDQDEPEMAELTYEYPEKDIWYRNQGRAIQYSFTLKDCSAIKGITMVADDGTEFVLTDDCKMISDRDDEGKFTYQITTADERFADTVDQNQNYYFVIEDEWGNVLSTKGNVNVVNMKIDNTAPSNVAYVKFTGDKDKLYNASGDLAGKHYQYGNGSSSGTVYNQKEVQLKIYAADLPGANAIDQAASGIVKVTVNYRYTQESVSLPKDDYTKASVTYGGESDTYAIKTPVTVTVNGQSLTMDELVFDLEIADGQKITSIDSIELWDAAGNYTKITEYADADDLTVDYVLDNTAPVLFHEIPGGSGYSKDTNTYYYNTNAVDLYVTIAENNFYAEDVSTDLKANEATKAITMSAFQDIGGYNYRSHFTMNEGDGIYRFTMFYQDRSENAMVFRGGGDAFVADGTYTSPILVVDTTAPVLNIRYYQGGKDITDSITNGLCFSGDVSAVISITEVNFDPDLVQIVFSATDASDNQAFGITYNPSAWSQNGDTYSYTIPCTAEGHYSITASCTDKAGNHSNGVPTSSYTIDKTVPAVAISYNTTVESGYYNTDRTATVTVTDQNFNEQAIEFVITTTGMQPALTGWSHAAGSGCDGTNHVKSCKWSCQATFSEDADYTFTFNCVDKAGNASAAVEEEAFTIDQTLPVIRVGYDNNDSLNGYYFKEGRTATITITEHNFNSSDVNLVISSPDGEVHSPSVWRSSTADVYVCEISYDADGDYTFDISYTDLAGNEAEEYAGDKFVIDLTAPELEISGVEDKSANNGIVAPVVSFSDKNYDAEEVTVTITGVNHGLTALEYAVTTNEDGQTIEFMDFSHTQDMDDLYTLEAVITDKAGNATEDNILFSVNRFGSVYIFSEDTQAVLDRFYTNQGPKLTVTEINVDTLEHQEISYSCDGDIVVLNQGTDYTVQESGSEYEWKQYTYEIAGSNFDTEGVYVVTLQSIDRAANDTTNRLKEKSIEFTVDKTAPSVVLGGIENGGSYAETSRTLTIDAVDNIYLESVAVYLNDELAVSFDEDTLAEYHGQVSYEVKESGAVQSVYIIARDAAGNEIQTDLIRFLISSNLLIRWFYNRPLFFGSIAGVLAVTGGVIFLIFRKRKKKEAEV